jgi:ABC-2 type transport system ATP-binding protein
MSIVTVRNLSKRFNDVVAVDDVSFELGVGEILGLLGPNGAGKTTTFQMLLGVLIPTSGSVSYFGRDLSAHRSEILERINFSSAYTNLPWNLKLSDNLAFLSRLYKISDRKRRVAEIIETFRLAPLLSSSVISLSAGELTRLNLAKAFLNDPEVVLLDEPTASLDPESAVMIREFILQRRKEQGLTVLFTSHNMAEIETVCDRVIFIHKGHIMADDTPSNLARTLDRCAVSLLVEEASAPSVLSVCAAFEVEPEVRGKEYTVRMPEARIADYLSGLTSRNVSLHGITVQRATLEDYFLSQAKQETAHVNV